MFLPLAFSRRRLVASTKRAKHILLLSRPNGAESSLYSQLIRHLQQYKKEYTTLNNPYALLGVFEVVVSHHRKRQGIDLLEF